MLLNCKQCHKNVNNVNDSNIGVNERIFFSFVRQMMQMNAQKCYWMLIKMQKSLLNLIYAQMFAFSRYWMYLRAVARLFTQMNAYFLVMNSKRCSREYSGNALKRSPPMGQKNLAVLTGDRINEGFFFYQKMYVCFARRSKKSGRNRPHH